MSFVKNERVYETCFKTKTYVFIYLFVILLLVAEITSNIKQERNRFE